MSEVPAEAITAGGNAMLARWQRETSLPLVADPMDWAATVLQAAEPVITAAERERIRQAVTGDEFGRALCGLMDAEEALDAVQAFTDLLAQPSAGGSA